ncbi:flavodoxin domain-containing protein [Candidatus Tremblaya phenacola]|uniref:Sulfite reductase [NADPH] flavoprotein alpha-component n=1 Tax=Candidatus Tremblayella phenacoccinincola TaxID=1010676 RepID=A0A2G0V6R0_9PROT|nr:flavodoxin domain-containing protein [Candidatus Tremblaya phenacola]PHN16176.1 Sulfite reductase [NADPH] flavoprotein alpha-component [Candidatus Tremblaya phenacola]
METTIISASQTGNSRELASLLYNAFIRESIKTINYKACDYDFKNISKERLLIVITSTYGEGEPPEEAVELYNYLFSIKAPLLINTKYAVFSLGDSTYKHFSKIGKDFDYRLAELGGKRIYKRIDADINYKDVFELWKKRLIKLLKEEYNTAANTTNNIALTNSKVNRSNICNRRTLYLASLSTIKKITSNYSIKKTFHIELNIDNDIPYIPGASLSVLNNNEEPLVKEASKYLRTSIDEYVYISRNKVLINTLIRSYFEVTQPSLIVIEKAVIGSKCDHLQMLLKSNNIIINAIKHISTIDFLRYIKLSLNANILIAILNRLKPRLYSIASSQLDTNKEVHLTVNLIEYNIDSYTRKGNTSNYLIRYASYIPNLKVAVQNNNSFSIPKPKHMPIIMFGSGTGIAPFRSFILHNKIVSSFKRCWLFFGNPSFNNDFLYQTEWKSYIKANILSKLTLVWSRDQAIKTYIQDLIRIKEHNIWLWIKEPTTIYICGNANYMAFELEAAIINVLCENNNISYIKAIIILNIMKANQQYQKDVY